MLWHALKADSTPGERPRHDVCTKALRHCVVDFAELGALPHCHHAG